MAPPSLAGKGAGGLGPAADPRLDQKVWIHATDQRIADLLADLTRATSVTLVPGMEVADERISFWADAIPLKEAMRDLRHLHGYYWSRARRGGQYVYSLWEDAQSRAREEAEIQRLALDGQREFTENIRKRVQALSADKTELKRLARDDPYLVAQMLHPVVRGGFQLFAALSPDQQAQLLQGQAPSRSLGSGELLDVFPLETITMSSSAKPGQTATMFFQPEHSADKAPEGDVVTLTWAELAPAQQAAVEAILRGAAAQQEKITARWHGGPFQLPIAALKAAQPETSTVSLFRWGDPDNEGMSLRLEFRSGGHPWALYSNFGVPIWAQRLYNNSLRKGEFGVWPGAQEDVDPYLDRRVGGADVAAVAPATSKEAPDPTLDAPISLDWILPRRDERPLLFAPEVLAALHGEIRRPLVLDGGGHHLDLPINGPAEFRWQNQPLRALLYRLFPGYDCSSSSGTLFLRSPDSARLSGRWHQVPPAVEQFLKQRQGPFTLDDLALLARSLSPWQIVKLQFYLPPAAIDQMLSAYELLRLYGELAPAQRAVLVRGLPFASLTPPQQALLLQFAQRQRLFAEPWSLQTGAVQLVPQPAPVTEARSTRSPRPVARMLFQVQFQEGDAQSFPVDLFAPPEQDAVNSPPSGWAGKPFPFHLARRMEGPAPPGPVWKPALADPRLRRRAELILLSRPFADPYVGSQSPPSPDALAYRLADRLRDTGLQVVEVTMQSWKETTTIDTPHAARVAGLPPNLTQLQDTGDVNGQPFDSANGGGYIDQWPTVFLVDRNELVQAVFQGQDAWDTAAIEAAARRAAPAGVPWPINLPAHRLAAH